VRVLDVIAYAMRHPLNRARPFAAAWRVLRWQAGTRLRPGPRIVPFVDGSVLQVARGMTGATGNVYCGLHEYAEMGFLLHWLREGECFLDIGANVGAWSVLAAAACGARVVAFEPDERARRGLAENLRANGIEARVEVHECAAAAARGTRWFTRDGDTTNHLVDAAGDASAARIEADTVDARVGARPVAMAKIDVEGAEREVLDGMRGILARGEPVALMVEFGGAGGNALLGHLVAAGFHPCTYDPAARRLQPAGDAAPSGNLLLLRDPAAAQARVAAAPRRRIHATGHWL
jgi:FkbM family methyltransferase